MDMSTGAYFCYLLFGVGYQVSLVHVKVKFSRSLPRSNISIFQVLTGGVDWDDIVRPLFPNATPVSGNDTCRLCAIQIPVDVCCHGTQ